MHEHRSSRRRRASVGTGTLALSLGLCLCAGQLVAAGPATAAPVVTEVAATTTTTIPAVASRITDSVNRKSIYRGQSVRVTARVVNPATGQVITSGTVRLQAWKGGTWRTLKAGTIRSSGRSWMWTSPTTATTYRTVFPSQNGYASSVGNPVRVTVKSSAGARILAEAKRHTGALYLFGATGPRRFDCSGFTKYVYRKAVGRSLPHRANAQQRYGRAVAKSQKKVGDLIVFRSGSYGYHVGIYAGNGYIYDSPHSGARVGKHRIWSRNYVVRRLAA